MVLTTGHWPTFPNPKLILPNEIIDYHSVFSLFYCKNNARKSLNFSSTQGFADMVA